MAQASDITTQNHPLPQPLLAHVNGVLSIPCSFLHARGAALTGSCRVCFCSEVSALRQDLQAEQTAAEACHEECDRLRADNAALRAEVTSIETRVDANATADQVSSPVPRKPLSISGGCAFSHNEHRAWPVRCPAAGTPEAGGGGGARRCFGAGPVARRGHCTARRGQRLLVVVVVSCSFGFFCSAHCHPVAQIL